MRRPLFENIEDDQGIWTCLPRPHPNRYFYKYRLRVFWRGSKNEGAAFLNDKANLLSLHEGWLLAEQIVAKGEPCYLYYTSGNLRADYSEKGLIAKIDRNSPRWQHIDFNDLDPAFEDDTDKEAHGFK